MPDGNLTCPTPNLPLVPRHHATHTLTIFTADDRTGMLAAIARGWLRLPCACAWNSCSGECMVVTVDRLDAAGRASDVRAIVGGWV